MTTLTQLESALHSQEPEQALRNVVSQLVSEGIEQQQVYQMLESLLLKLRGGANGQPADEDAVLNVMDSLVGWCHPRAQISTPN